MGMAALPPVLEALGMWFFSSVFSAVYILPELIVNTR